MSFHKSDSDQKLFDGSTHTGGEGEVIPSIKLRQYGDGASNSFWSLSDLWKLIGRNLTWCLRGHRSQRPGFRWRGGLGWWWRRDRVGAAPQAAAVRPEFRPVRTCRRRWEPRRVLDDRLLLRSVSLDGSSSSSGWSSNRSSMSSPTESSSTVGSSMSAYPPNPRRPAQEAAERIREAVRVRTGPCRRPAVPRVTVPTAVPP